MADKKPDGPRLVKLRLMLKARTGKKEYEENCKELRAEIARLEQLRDGYDL